jgi:hypothetical protein
MRLSVAAFFVAAVMEATTPTGAQNFNELDRQRAARQAQAEWRRVVPAELAFIDQRLRPKGSNIEALVRRGVKPSAAWLAELRSSCRDFVGRVQTDNAPALAGDANGSPTETISQSDPNEPKNADVTPSTESLKDSSVTPRQVAEEQVKQGDVEPKNRVQRGIMEWPSATFLFAIVTIAVLLAIVIYLFIRWRGTGRRTAAVSLPEKDSDGGGKTPLNGTIAEAGKAVGPSAVKEIQRPDETGRSAAASMSQESAHGSLPTYGELFPEIVSMKPRNSG